MKKPIKFFALFITFMFFALCFSINAYAAENTLGEEQPYLYGVYYNSNGDEVDGNTLAPGDYTVDIMLEGMKNLSVFQYTAEYDPSVVTAISTDAVITGDGNDDLSLGGIKTDDAANGKKRVVLALASKAEYCTALDQGDAVAIARMNVTVAGEAGAVIDFQDCFDFVTDPDLTFAEADYRDDIEDAYVLDTTVATTYNKYLMTADITPEDELDPTITVNGKILIASDVNGESGTFGLRGVKVYAYDNEGNVIAETVSNATGDVSTWGDYTLEVPAGTTRFVVGDPVNADTIANREFTITGDADVMGANVPVVMCDYNDDGYVNNTDTGQYGLMLKGSYSVYADFNIDGYVNNTDTGQYGIFLKGCKNGISYTTQLSF